MRILIKFPTRSRRELFFKVLNERYLGYLSGKHDVQVVVTMDVDDPEMNRDDVRRALDAIPGLRYAYGHSRTKIEAVNADMDLADPWDVLILASDDMVPFLQGYDDIVARDFKQHAPNLYAMMHYFDGREKKLATLQVMGRPMYQEWGFIYHPALYSLYADDLAMAYASLRNALIDRTDTLLATHGWIQTTGRDALHIRNSLNKVGMRDKAVFESMREHQFRTDWFPPPELMEQIQRWNIPGDPLLR